MHMNNPAAAALMSKMHYTKQERVEVRKVFLRQLLHMDIDDAHRSLINGFFESYLHLNNEEEAKLMNFIHYRKRKKKRFFPNGPIHSAIDLSKKALKKRKKKKGLNKDLSKELNKGLRKAFLKVKRKGNKKLPGR
ncbi:hypothetical protein QS257_17825 [Terrilactibacillus sp. S3-3]|nr:hypothetical protein QS257_17825 [Terrilactibacillus sp. S3-3]